MGILSLLWLALDSCVRRNDGRGGFVGGLAGWPWIPAGAGMTGGGALSGDWLAGPGFLRTQE